MNYLIVADNLDDNEPTGVMVIDTPDINKTIEEVFTNEPDCNCIRYGLIYTPDLPGGVMVNWSALTVVLRKKH